MYILAHQSPAFPPGPNDAVMLRTMEIFITIFLTMEMSLEFFVIVGFIPSREFFRGLKQYFKDPWHFMDLCVLGTFWLYIMYPAAYMIQEQFDEDTRAWLAMPKDCPAWLSALRTLRVLRPMRTLRMLGDIQLVAECTVCI
jgi:hypothetical protein